MWIVSRGGEENYRLPPASCCGFSLESWDLVNEFPINHRGHGGHKKSRGDKGLCPKHSLHILILFLEAKTINFFLPVSVRVSTDPSPHWPWRWPSPSSPCSKSTLFVSLRTSARSRNTDSSFIFIFPWKPGAYSCLINVLLSNLKILVSMSSLIPY